MLALRDLQQFLVLAEELNFSHAAERLHVSQPTLTQTIQRLERQCGAKLLERSTRNSRLTDAGQALLRGATILVRDAEALEKEVRAVGSGKYRHLRVGAVNPAMRRLVPGVLHTVHAQFPDLRISLHPLASHSQISALRESRLDLAIVRTSVPIPGFTSDVLMHEPLFAVVPSDHPLAGSPRVRLGQLSGLDFVMAPRERNPEFYDDLVALYAKYSCVPGQIVEADNMHAQLALVGAGIGVAVQPLLFVDRDREDVVFLPLEESLGIPLQILYPEGDRSDVLQAFMTAAREQAEHLMAETAAPDG